MNYVVAVSGGVDSVVLLDKLAKSAEHSLTVAHFDHGIRPESADDAAFVRALATRYGLPFEVERAELGPDCSEETARIHRYDFLRRVAAKSGGTLVTAHHQDDVIETIAINLTRGTGWRGLAVMNDRTIERPLLDLRKQELYAYAVDNGLEWVEDATNGSDTYLRNRLRRSLGRLDRSSRERLVGLYRLQLRLAFEIKQESRRLMTNDRHFLTMVDDSVASELIREILCREGCSLTRPQRARMSLAIKTARAGSILQAGDGVTIGFTAREFIVKHP